MVLQSILISVALGLSSNLDNIPIGLTCGSRKLRIPWLYTLLASLASFGACWLAGSAGLAYGGFLPDSASKWFGSAILISVGLWLGLQFLFDMRRNSEPNPLFQNELIGFSEWMFIGLTQVMADLAIGFAVGFTHHSVFATALYMGIFNGLLLNASAWMGRQSVKRQTRTVSSRASFVSGLLLIVIGLYL